MSIKTQVYYHVLSSGVNYGNVQGMEFWVLHSVAIKASRGAVDNTIRQDVGDCRALQFKGIL